MRPVAGEVTLVSMAPNNETAGLRTALAMGAAKAILVSDDALSGAGALDTAKVLAAAIKRAEPDLVLAATESSDGYTGTVPEQVAALLGLPSITFAKHVEISGETVSVQRQTELGYDEVETTLPALVSVTAGVVEPRYPSFKGIMAAKSKPVDQLSLADLGIDAGTVGSAGAGQEIVAVDDAPPARPARSSRTTARATPRSSPTSRTSRSSDPDPDEHAGDTTVMALNRIWVYAEAADGKVAPITLEILTKARELAAPSRPSTATATATPSPRSSAPTAPPGSTPPATSRVHPGRAGRVGHRRAHRGRRAAGPHPVRHHLRGSRRRRPPVGGARPAGHHQQHRHRGGRRRGRRHRAGVRRHQAGPHQVHGQRPTSP